MGHRSIVPKTRSVHPCSCYSVRSRYTSRLPSRYTCRNGGTGGTGWARFVKYQAQMQGKTQPARQIAEQLDSTAPANHVARRLVTHGAWTR